MASNVVNQMTSCTLTTFNPPSWLGNRHIQTILPALLCKGQRYESALRRQEIQLDDGDTLDLLWNTSLEPKDGAPITLLLHGLGGSEKSHYIRRMLRSFSDQNQHAAVLLFRDCGPNPNRLSKSYHAGETSDLDFVVNILARKYPASPLQLLGYSLGANVMLKYLGEQKSSTRPKVTKAAAVSTPFELANGSSSLNRNWVGRFYQRIFLHGLKNKLKRKFLQPGYHTPPMRFNLFSALHARTLRQYDELCTAPLNGFKSSQDYYDLSSCRQFLNMIAVPTLILHSSDDPLLTPDAIPQVGELGCQVELENLPHGGHVGFLTTKAASGSGKGLFDRFHFVFWADRRLLQWFGVSR